MEIVPQAPEAWLGTNLRHLNRSMYLGAINTSERKAAYIAQLAHESDRFRTTEEYASGSGYDGRADLGNTEPGDGRRFKGRGAIQVTGRDNYRAASEHFGVDFVAHLELLAEPEWAFRVSERYWTSHGLNEDADRGDFDAITRTINGAYNGKADRDALHGRALEVFGR